MTTCVWCGRAVTPSVTLATLWRWQPLVAPVVCAACRARLQPLHAPQCPRCARQQTTPQVCHDCARWGDAWVNHAIFPYDATLKAYMQQYKFQGDYRLRVVMQPYIRRALAQETYDLLVPIPVTAGPG